ncbi:MAG: carbohydrate ABC transporter permease [Lachnospira sp.]|nr:carbohydrate ABC transporter permease [Lachnospira sp.]
MKLKTKEKIIPYILLIFGTILILFPVYICLVTTFKGQSETATSYFSLPKSLYLGNFQEILNSPKLYYAYGNTLFITGISLIGSLILMPAMSFSISRGMRDSKVFRAIYFYLLVGIFIPFQVRMVPLVKLLTNIGMMNQVGLTILYIAHATCESVFLYTGYLNGISQSLEESAYIDGATTFIVYRKIILPLMKPIIVTVMIREGLATWNDYLLPLITLNKSWKMWTLTLYQNAFQSEFSVNYNQAFACFVLASLPVVIAYLILQKQIIGGLTAGAVKG